jgi:tetratricopeptide (TPR) repeat protein
MIAHAIAVSTVRGNDSAESLRAFADARALGASIPQSLDHIAALGFTVAGKVATGHFREARSLAEEILALSRVAKSRPILMVAHVSAASALVCLGEIEAARDHLERGIANIEVTERTVDRNDPSGAYGVLTAHLFLGVALIVAGRPQRGRASIDLAVRFARATEMPGLLVYALSTASDMAIVRRDPVEARRLVMAALACEEENDLAVWKPLNQVRLGWLEARESGDPHIIEPLWTVVEALRANGHFRASRMYGLLADACANAGRLDDATRALDAAFDTRGEERLFDAELFRLRGVIVSKRAQTTGAIAEAEQMFEQAIEVATLRGMRLFGLRATVDLCRLWVATGKRDPARPRLSEALGVFDEGFGETDLREARALLDELEAGS